MVTNIGNQIKIQLTKPLVEYMSLKNNYICNTDLKSKITSELINYLKIGTRINAIEYLLSENIGYNEAITLIKYCENNLNSIIKDLPDCWFEDSMGELEFEPIQSLFDCSQDFDSRLNNYILDIDCDTLDITKTLKAKSLKDLQYKAEETIKNIAGKWYKEFHKYHETRENTIVSQINQEQNNIFNVAIKKQIPLFEWDSLKDNSEFISNIPIVKRPSYQKINIDLIQKELEHLENNPPHFNYNDISLIRKIFTFIDECFNKKYLMQEWENECRRKRTQLKESKIINAEREQKFNEEIVEYREYQNKLNQEKEEFYNRLENKNKIIEDMKELIKNRGEKTVEKFFRYVLQNSIYPILFEKDFAITYNNQNNILVVDYFLPSINDIYNIQAIKYVATNDEFKISYLKPKELDNLFDTVMYQICMRSIFELFTSDNVNCLNAIVFNGYTKGLDKSNGKEKIACILSLQVSRENFNNINFDKIDVKSCFKALKGVSAVELSTLTPIRPILQFNKDDDRFVDAYNVIEHVEEGYNLATMNWQDFENLVREIFEKEFSQNGGEVKITQASRDNGVDAIAFDPDPIRGGKIVIQAKCYTNIVGISAVRDLFGTVHNEGAIKGILITTSDYGADSYEFAKDKPLTLLNGNHLLHLLEKHGHKARIDLNEAKQINKELVSVTYYVENNGTNNMLHKENCIWLNKENAVKIGDFSSMEKASKTAKNHYSKIEICEKCCESMVIYNK